MMKIIALAFVLLLSGCGRPSDPVEIPPEELPFSVARTQEESPAPSPGPESAIYLVDDDRLIAVTRRTETVPRPEIAVLRALLEGPTSAERARGITTLIPSGVRVQDVRVRAENAQIDLSGEFERPASPERIALRVGQVVWTLTDLDRIRTVSFWIDGEPISVITASGDHVERRLTRADYSDLAPRD